MAWVPEGPCTPAEHDLNSRGQRVGLGGPAALQQLNPKAYPLAAVTKGCLYRWSNVSLGSVCVGLSKVLANFDIELRKWPEIH